MLRDVAYLVDILEAAQLALSYTDANTEEEFYNNQQCQDAVVRRLEIIGEAARRVSIEVRSAYPDLPWEEMIGLRNLLIHEYDDIDLSVVWQTVR